MQHVANFPIQPPAEAHAEVSQDAWDAWDAALAAYRAAQAAYDAHSKRAAEIEAGLRASIPDSLAEENRFGRTLRWHSLKMFDHEHGSRQRLTEDLARVRVELAAFLPDYHRRYEELGCRANDDRLEELDDIVLAALDALSAVPAPDAEALAVKIEIESRRTDEEGLGLADPACLSQQLHGYQPGRTLAAAYLDLLQMAGRPRPLGADFNPRAWIKSYEAAGGAVKERDDYLYLLLGRAWEGCDRATCRALEDELYVQPWKAAAVYREVRDDGYRTRIDPTTNRGRFSWVCFVDSAYRVLTPRIHFGAEAHEPAVAADEDILAAAPDHARTPEAAHG